MKWKSWFSRATVIRNLEYIQNLIIVILSIGIFGVMIIRIVEMFSSLIAPINFKSVTSDILFILILVELFRLLIIYLKEQRVSVGAALEISLVSALREVLLQGVLEIPPSQLLGTCTFLGILGVLLLMQIWTFQVKQVQTQRLEETSVLMSGEKCSC